LTRTHEVHQTPQLSKHTQTSKLFTDWILQDNTFKFQTIFEIRLIHYSPNSVKSDIFTIILCVVLYRAAHYLSWLDKHSKHRSCTFFWHAVL